MLVGVGAAIVGVLDGLGVTVGVLVGVLVGVRVRVGVLVVLRVGVLVGVVGGSGLPKAALGSTMRTATNNLMKNAEQ